MAAPSPQIPPHEVNGSPGDSTTSIDIQGWTITSTSLPISNATEIDQLQETLHGLPIPEMPFGNNSIVLKHEASGWEYSFTALGALSGVKLGEPGDGDGGVKVGYAKEWMQSRLEPNSDTPMPETSPTKAYDWTYTTTYPGKETEHSSPHLRWTPADPENPSHSIPLAQLSRRDPILYYAEILLYEDELHDNGSSRLVVRLRVMPTCLFILSRLTVRVDGVVFRTFDTRIYHSFEPDPHSTSATPHVVRECSGWEAPYDTVKRHLPNPNDLTPLTDANFIAQVLTQLPKSVSQNPRAKSGTDGTQATAEEA
ncbi:hypothetical protein FRC04_000091 [Tulasnella sp. 424]|nr:hypothetical protein FRC04_000091 [Tulasnella sp. 424]KAG8981953.1 hypothetical protein FRC05_000095 [Tulasnella sp. 425]